MDAPALPPALVGAPNPAPSLAHDGAALLSPAQARKRAAILAGAREVFLRDGFAAGSVDDVAAAAGVGKQTVYRHFGSKEALVTALVEAMCGEMGRAAPEGGPAAGDGGAGGVAPLEDRLRALGRAAVRGLATPDSLRLYRAVVAEAGRAPALGRLFFNAGPRRLRALAVNLLADRLGPAAPERAEQFIQAALGEAYLELVLEVAEPPAAVPGEALSARFARQLDAAVEIALR